MTFLVEGHPVDLAPATGLGASFRVGFPAQVKLKCFGHAGSRLSGFPCRLSWHGLPGQVWQGVRAME